MRFCKIIGDQHSDGMEAYLLMMASRLLMCHRILKETGSIFLHCDHSANGYLRMLMDAIFGKENFRNEIVWSYNKWTNACKYFQRNHDTILFYAKNAELAKFNKLFGMTPHKAKVEERGWGSNKVEKGKVRQLLVYDREKARDEIAKPKYDRVVYLDDKPSGTALSACWTDIQYLGSGSKERCRLGNQKWTDQKPVALYTRLIEAVTNEGDLVMDPFCGCATTLIAAEKAGCQWIGIDSHKERAQLIRPQMEKLITSDVTKWKQDFKIITDERKYPKRTDNKLSAAERKLIKDEKILEQLERRPYLRCDICGTPKDKFDLEIEHIQAKSKRGGKEPTNFQLACSRCNRRKGSTKTNKEVWKELEAEGLLYHQRAAVYHELTGDSIRDSEAYLEEEANPKSEPRRNRKRAKKVSRRKKDDSQQKIGLKGI